MATNTLNEWFAGPLGQYLLGKERAWLDDVTPDIFGFHALQVGLPEHDLLRESRIAHRMRIAPWGGGVDLRAKTHELPIATQSIDLAILPHVLEFADEPHAILREIDRVMMPEGRLVILGFNPWSLWGLRSSVGFSQEFPWNGSFVALPRVKDWLSLLGFDVSAGRLAAYVPPFESEKWRRRFGLMEPAGDRWWAIGGAVYMLQAVKRVRGMRLLTPAWQEKAAREKSLVAAAKREGHAKTANLRIVK